MKSLYNRETLNALQDRKKVIKINQGIAIAAVIVGVTIALTSLIGLAILAFPTLYVLGPLVLGVALPLEVMQVLPFALGIDLLTVTISGIGAGCAGLLTGGIAGGIGAITSKLLQRKNTGKEAFQQTQQHFKKLAEQVKTELYSTEISVDKQAQLNNLKQKIPMLQNHLNSLRIFNNKEINELISPLIVVAYGKKSYEQFQLIEELRAIAFNGRLDLSQKQLKVISLLQCSEIRQANITGYAKNLLHHANNMKGLCQLIDIKDAEIITLFRQLAHEI